MLSRVRARRLCNSASKVSPQIKEVAKFSLCRRCQTPDNYRVFLHFENKGDQRHQGSLSWGFNCTVLQMHTQDDSLRTQQHTPAFCRHHSTQAHTGDLTDESHDQTWLELHSPLSGDCLETENTGEILAQGLNINRVHCVFSACNIPPLISPGPLYFIGLCVRLPWRRRCQVCLIRISGNSLSDAATLGHYLHKTTQCRRSGSSAFSSMKTGSELHI